MKGDWLGEPENWKERPFVFAYDVERTTHVTLTVHSLTNAMLASVECRTFFIFEEDFNAIFNSIRSVGNDMTPTQLQ